MMPHQEQKSPKSVSNAGAERPDRSVSEAMDFPSRPTEETLRRFDEKFNLIFKGSHDGVIITRLDDGTILDVNDSFLRTMGYTRDQVLGQPTTQIQTWADPQDRDRFVRTLKEQEKCFGLKTAFRLRDGVIVPAVISAGLVEVGGESCIIWIIHDMSNLVRAEEALRRSEKRYRQLVEKATDIIYTTDTQGFFTFVNPAAVRITGYSGKEILGKQYLDFIHPDYREQAEKFYKSQFANRISDTYYEFPILTKTGETIWLGQNVQLAMEGDEITGFRSICRDITVRKKAQERLYRSESRFRLLAEAAPFGLSVMLADGRVQYVNPKFTELFGYTIEDVPDKDAWFEKAYPDKNYRNMVVEVWTRDTQENVVPGEVCPRVFTVRCKDGSDKVIQFRAVVIERGAQILTFEDITLQARSAQALHDKEQMLTNILAASPVGICRVEERKVSWVNEAMIQMFGYNSAQEFIGKTTQELYASVDEYERVGSKLYENHGIGTESETYAKLIRKDGTVFDGHVRISAPNPFDRMRGTIAAFTDVSRLREAERALEESERRYRRLVEQVPDVIFSLDSSGRFIFINVQVVKFLGYPISRILGKFFWDLAGPEYKSLAQSVLKVQPETIWDEELGVTDSLGGQKWVRIRCQSSFDEEGRLIGFEGVMMDRTLRKRLEEDLRASREQLLAKIKIIDDLYAHMVQSEKTKAIAEHTAEVAHELRQPLAIIGGFARRMGRQLEETGGQIDLSSQKDALEIIIKEVQRLETILGGLIDFSRREAIRLTGIDANSFIQELLHIHEERFRAKKLRVKTVFGGGIGEVFLDRNRFGQVVRNLLSNAIEASQQNGLIEVRTRLFKPSGKAQKTGELTADAYFEMKVKNGGRVIPPDEIQRLFDPFYTTKGYGIGIGLTVAKKIIDEHNGSISVKSDMDGTVFTVWIPLKPTKRMVPTGSFPEDKASSGSGEASSTDQEEEQPK